MYCVACMLNHECALPAACRLTLLIMTPTLPASCRLIFPDTEHDTACILQTCFSLTGEVSHPMPPAVDALMTGRCCVVAPGSHACCVKGGPGQAAAVNPALRPQQAVAVWRLGRPRLRAGRDHLQHRNAHFPTCSLGTAPLTQQGSRDLGRDAGHKGAADRRAQGGLHACAWLPFVAAGTSTIL